MTQASTVATLSKNTLSMYGAYAVRKVSVFILAVVIARQIGVAGFGLYCLALVWMEFAIRLAAFGTDVLIVRDISAAQPDAERLVGNALGWRLLSSVFIYPLLIAGAALISRSPGLSQIVALMGAGMILHTLADLYLSVIQGRERIDLFALVEGATSLAGLGFALAAVYAGFGLAGVAVAYSLRGAFNLAMAYALCRRHSAPVRLQFAPRFVFGLLKKAAPIGANRFLTIVYLGSGLTLLQYFRDETTVGQFAGAMKLFETCTSVGMLTMIAAFPTLSRLRIESRDELRQTTQSLIRFFCWLGLPASLLIALYAGPLLRWLFGPSFAACGPALAILMLAVPFSLNYEIVERLAYAAHDQLRTFLVRAVGTLLNIAVIVVLVNRSGYLAPAFALLAAEAAMFALFWSRWAHYVPGLVYRREVLPPVALALLALAPAAFLPAAWQPAAGAAFLALFLALSLIRRAAQPIAADPFASFAWLPPASSDPLAWRLAESGASAANRSPAAALSRWTIAAALLERRLRLRLRAALRYAVALLSIASGLAVLIRRRTWRRHAVVLGYHRVADGDDPLNLNVGSARFMAQMRYLQRRRVGVALDELAADGAVRSLNGRGAVAVTFDDGYRGNRAAFIAGLRNHNIPATLYLATGLIDQAQSAWWEELAEILQQAGQRGLTLVAPDRRLCLALRRRPVRHLCTRLIARRIRHLEPAERTAYLQDLARSGGLTCPAKRQPSPFLTWTDLRELREALPQLAIGSHTQTHLPLMRGAREQLRAQLHGSKADIETHLGLAPRHFSYPSGSDLFEEPESRSVLQADNWLTAATNASGFNAPGADALALRRIGIGNESLPVFIAKISGVFDAVKRHATASRSARNTGAPA
jgi:O-antigen/teichoic acid export membrane protein/peptidoglycan/xylan/chitin deacetylase (PgdA/CDA1 family)